MDHRHSQQHSAASPRVMQVPNSPSARLRSSESWIEIASQSPSPSLLPGTNDNTLLHLPIPRRRRRTNLVMNIDSRRPSIDCSSQEEYDESESESDRAMTSSNECLAAGNTTYPNVERLADVVFGQNDEQNHGGEGESSTTIGVATNLQCFTPQPNAFSHPPSSHSRQQDAVPGSYFPPARPVARSAPSRTSFAENQARRSQTHSPYNMISPSHHTDHDAALRASLSTLLSCAAAARGLPKSAETSKITRPHASSSRVDPTTLRMVPEAVALGERQTSSYSPRDPNSTSSSRESLIARATNDKGKRKANRSTSKDRRVLKKPRHAGADESISPTLLTWVTAAGVVVLVSALSFSSGYVIGRETGRMEAGGSLQSTAAGIDCGKEAARGGLGLKRLRWGSAGSVVVS